MARPRSNDFEEIYLRMSTLRRFVHKANPAVVNDPDFKRTVKYMTARYFSGYKSFLKQNGFDREDLENIITLFALAFEGMPQKIEVAQSHKYKIMMRFIQQKCNFFLSTVARKFNSNDTMVVSFENFSGMESGKKNSSIEMSGERMWTGTSAQVDDQDDRAEFLENNLFMIEEKIKTAVGLDKFDLKMQRNDIRRELEAVNKTIAESKREFNSTRKETLDKLRQLFLADPHKYSNQLSYYATTKHVSKDVRKKARLMCNKYGIDYKKWLKEKLNDFATDSMEFDCS